MEDCIEACGKVVTCHSVDYDIPRKAYCDGNHHGPRKISEREPHALWVALVRVVASCGKGRCKSYCRPPTGSSGIEMAINDEIFKGEDKDNYPSFKPEAFKGKTPESTDIVQDVSFHNSNARGLLANKAIMYRTHLFT